MVHFKCCGHGQKISVFIPQKFEFLEMLLLVTVLRLCIPSGDYSSCLDRSFWILGKISKKQSLFEMKVSLVLLHIEPPIYINITM